MTAGILLIILQGVAKLVRDLATAITGKVETPHGIGSARQDEPQ
jgi:TRAP-type mannitol/chloroaromatic compound transport system permease small subunit